jgi:hypothetical protein
MHSGKCRGSAGTMPQPGRPWRGGCWAGDGEAVAEALSGCWPAQVHAIMVGPDVLLVALDQLPVPPDRLVSVHPSRFSAVSTP